MIDFRKRKEPAISALCFFAIVGLSFVSLAASSGNVGQLIQLMLRAEAKDKAKSKKDGEKAVSEVSIADVARCHNRLTDSDCSGSDIMTDQDLETHTCENHDTPNRVGWTEWHAVNALTS